MFQVTKVRVGWGEAVLTHADQKQLLLHFPLHGSTKHRRLGRPVSYTGVSPNIAFVRSTRRSSKFAAPVERVAWDEVIIDIFISKVGHRYAEKIALFVF
jgi:hypothetical protein